MSVDENIVPASSAETNPDATTAQESSTSAPDANTSQSSSGEGAVDTGSPSTESEQAGKTARETLIVQLTGKKEEEQDEEPEAPEQEPKAESTETTKPDAPAPTEQAAPVVETEDDLVAPPKDAKPKQKHRWDRLVADRKAKIDELAKLKPMAEYGQSMLDVASEAKMQPQTLGAWIALGAEVHADPARMPLRLYAEAEKLARQMNVQLPVQQQTVEPLHSVAAELEDMILNDVAEMDVSKETAKKYLDKIRATRGAAAKPAPVQTPPPQPTQFVQQQQPAAIPAMTQEQFRVEAVTRVATAELDRLHNDYEKQYPTDWAKIRAIAKEGMKQYSGTDPARWPAFFKREVELAKAQIAKPPTKPPVLTQTLRPTTEQSKTKNLSAREQLKLDLQKGRA